MFQEEECLPIPVDQINANRVANGNSTCFEDEASSPSSSTNITKAGIMENYCNDRLAMDTRIISDSVHSLNAMPSNNIANVESMSTKPISKAVSMCDLASVNTAVKRSQSSEVCFNFNI